MIFSLAARYDGRWDLFTAASKPVFLLALISGVVCLLARNTRFTVLALAAAILMLLNWRLGPQASWSHHAPSTSRVLLANVWNKNRNTEPFKDLVQARQPDLVILVEVHEPFFEMAKTLSSTYPFVLFVDDPETDDNNVHRARRLLAFSKTPMEWAPRSSARGHANYGIVDWTTPTGEPLRFVMTHITRPWPYSENGTQMTEVAEVAEIAALTQADMIAGDFNAVTNSAVITHIHNVTGLSPVEGMQGTFHSDAPELLRISIDHILLSDAWKVNSREVLEDVESDHLPILIEITR